MTTGHPRKPVDLTAVPPALRAIIAGVAGLIAWEAFASLIAPLWIGERLDPSGLVQAAFGIQSAAVALLVHIATGLVVFPLVYAWGVERVLPRLVPGMPWIVRGLLYGAGLWVFAMWVVAGLLAGFPAFLGFGTVAWASLAGHLAYGVVLAAASDWLESRARDDV